MLIPNLSVLLAERGLTITRLSRDTGLSRTTLTALASHAAKGIQFDTLNTLCQYLKVGPGELFAYRPFDLSVMCEGLPGRSLAWFTTARAGGEAERCPLACDAEYRFDPQSPGVLRRLTVRLSLPEGPEAEAARRLVDRLRALPPCALADLERDLLAAFDEHIGPDLAPRDYAPELAWPWEAP